LLTRVGECCAAARFLPGTTEPRHEEWNMKRTAVLLVSLSLASAACSWFDSPAPDEARLVIEGDPGTTVRVIVSTRFLAAVNDRGQTRVEIFQSDTIVATLPYDRVYTIEDDQRFFAETARLEADLANLRMQVFIDGRRQFDEVGALIANAPYRFVYTFNQPLTRDIEVL
jgi:hypothetical protein